MTKLNNKKRVLIFLSLIAITIFAVSTTFGVYLEPFETPTQEIFFKDFNGNGHADMAIRTITGGANGDVDVYFYNTNAKPDAIEAPTNGDFENGTLSGWTVTGTAFNSNPTTNNPTGVFGYWKNDYYVNTIIPGEAAVGTLTSSPFELSNQLVAFMIAGYNNHSGLGQNYNYVTLHLASDDSEIDRVYAPGFTKGMKNDFLDGGSANVGQQVYIKVTDASSIGGYCWMSVDYFRVVGNFYQSFNQTPDISATGVTVNNTTDWGLFFADINGDEKADLINHNRVNGDVFAYYNQGNSFSSSADKTYNSLTPVGSQYRIFFEDINNDNYDDYCILNMQSGYFEAFRNINTVFDSTAHIQQTIGVTSYPFNGNETLLSDLDGDGKADFVNFDQNTTTFTAHINTGTLFEVTGKSFAGFPAKYEYQYFLEDFDADGKSDFAQLNLREGDIILHNINQNAMDDFSVEMFGFGRARADATFILPSEGREMIQVDNHSVNAIMWYDNDHLPEITDRGNRGPTGWPDLNPNHPNLVPDDGTIYRSTNPTLGLYDSKDRDVIKQHAYWMKSMGIDSVLIDFTNTTSTEDTGSHLFNYTLALHLSLMEMIETYKTITEFVPPKIVIAFRMLEEYTPFTVSQQIADDMWEIYQRNPEMFFTTHDGSANHAKPILIAFTNFEDSDWGTTGPVWTDSRFNMRFMNGGIRARNLADYESYWWNRVKDDDWPYWTFIEAEEITPGYYRNTYRRLPGTSISEQSHTWIATDKQGTAIDWDGQFDLVDDRYLIDRYSIPLKNKPPRISLINRWNYPVCRYEHPQEGVSLNWSTMIEPNVDVGFGAFDRSAEQVYILRGLVEKPSSKPIIKSVSDGIHVDYSSGNFPTQYKVSDDELGVGEDWQYIDVNNPVIELPATLQNKSFYLRTKNPFGESEFAKFDVEIDNHSFEVGTLTNWTAIGPAWQGQPKTDSWPSSGYDGNYHVCSFLCPDGVNATGILRSADFSLTANQQFSFYIGGWSKINGEGTDFSYVTLNRADDNSELNRVWAPGITGDMVLKQLSHGLNENLEVYIEVVDNDEDSTGWGWISVDDFDIVEFDYRLGKNNGFELGNFSDWTVSGTAFGSSPQDFDTQRNGWNGRYFANSAVGGEPAIGTLRSPDFSFGNNSTATFLISGWASWQGGGSPAYNYVALKRASNDSEIERIWAPNITSTMIEKYFVSQLLTENVYFEVVDNCTSNGFGWIAVDDFQIVGIIPEPTLFLILNFLVLIYWRKL